MFYRPVFSPKVHFLSSVNTPNFRRYQPAIGPIPMPTSVINNNIGISGHFFHTFSSLMVESESRYDTRVMAESSDDEETHYNFKTLFKHMHSESKRQNVVSGRVNFVDLAFLDFKFTKTSASDRILLNLCPTRKRDL